jgi:hypothetical protein
MPDDANAPIPLARFTAPDGASIAEAELTAGHHGAVEDLIRRALALGVDKLWVHAHVVGAGLGFTHRGSYTRLSAPRPPDPVALPYPPRERIPEIQRLCFSGVWGRQDPGPPDPDSVFVALHERGSWVGICEIDPDAQWIDGPGVAPGFRTPDRYARLVRGAAAYLREEPVLIETWGDAPSTLEAYESLGFEVASSVSGWELVLNGPR